MTIGSRVFYHYLGDLMANGQTRLLQSVPASVLHVHSDGAFVLDLHFDEADVTAVGDDDNPIVIHKSNGICKVQSHVPMAATWPPEPNSWTPME